MTYYVYVHRRKDNNSIFYVGKGKGYRFSSNHRNNKNWHRIVKEAGGFIPEIVFNHLTEDDALKLESDFILNLNDLVNKKTHYNVISLQEMNLSDKLEYCNKSPSGLIWKVNVSFGKSFREKGSVAGHFSKHLNYWTVGCDGKLLLAHRVVYFLKYGEIEEGLLINHIDCNTRNNTIENLETVTICENNQRRFNLISEKVSKSNSSGYTGLTIEKIGNYTRIRARWTDNGTRRTKTFKVDDEDNIDHVKELAVKYLRGVKNGSAEN